MTWGFQTCGPNEALVVSGKKNISSSAIQSQKKIDSVSESKFLSSLKAIF